MEKTIATLILLALCLTSAAVMYRGPDGYRKDSLPTTIPGERSNVPASYWLENGEYWIETAQELADHEARAAAAVSNAAVSLAESLDIEIDAAQLKALLLSTVEALPESEQAELPTFFPAWRPGTAYAISNKLQHSGQLYRVVQAHTSQMDWPPDAVPALFVAIAPPGTIAAWSQPAGAHDAYAMGDQVTHSGQTWTSTAANNVWEPGVYGWEAQ